MLSPIEPISGAPASIQRRTTSRCPALSGAAPLGIGLPSTFTLPGSVAARNLLHKKLSSGRPGMTRCSGLIVELCWMRLLYATSALRSRPPMAAAPWQFALVQLFPSKTTF